MGIDRVLRGHDLFSLLHVDQMNQLSRFSSVKQYQPGDLVFAHNDVAGHVYMLMNGGVQLQLPSGQADVSFAISNLARGELFGLSPLLDSPHYTATAVCTDTTELLSIEAKPFRLLLQDNCQVGFQIMNRVAHIYFSRYIEVLKNLKGVVNQLSLIH